MARKLRLSLGQRIAGTNYHATGMACREIDDGQPGIGCILAEPKQEPVRQASLMRIKYDNNIN